MSDLAPLRLLQLFDSAFPVGTFAFSSGLETYAQRGLDRKGLRELLQAQLEHGFGRLDAAACVLAYRTASVGELADLCDTLSAWKPVPGVQRTSLQLGKRLLVLARRLYPKEADFTLEVPHQAVVVGALGQRLGIGEEPLVSAFLHSSLTAALAAATRTMPLSPEQAQEILTALHAQLPPTARRVLDDPESNLYSATPALDLRAHQQAHLYTRLFQS